MNSDLQRFVREALGRGLQRPAIRDALTQAGWRADEVSAALNAFAETDFPVPVPRRRPYLNAREAFLYLVLFATLYTSAFNTGQVLFALIERWVPDALGGRYDWRSNAEWARGATAGIIIAFPIFLLLSRVIGREVDREPEKRGSPIRKWLTYITLLVAALVIIGDLTVLVTRLLGGELAPRFLLKTLVVFLIAAIVFGHYLTDLRRDEADAGTSRPRMTLQARAAAIAVFMVMVAGLFMSGRPGDERARQLDQQRIMALETIRGSIQMFHGARHRLPSSLEELQQQPDGIASETMLDPVTSRPYEYRTLDSLGYELCAEFEAADLGRPPLRRNRPTPSGSEFWRHPAGRKCFHLEVTVKER
ncbi:MAG TPA: DUF5671 domain-containing protein [Candidatus Eisenbacteria bacterium]|nr:DUF5671 domain-containing protein [Candidatus Eisenbacteria bacterium]